MRSSDQEISAYFGFDNGTQTLLGDGQEGVAMRGSLHGIHGDVDGAVGPVLEPDSTREGGREFSVDLQYEKVLARAQQQSYVLVDFT